MSFQICPADDLIVQPPRLGSAWRLQLGTSFAALAGATWPQAGNMRVSKSLDIEAGVPPQTRSGAASVGARSHAPRRAGHEQALLDAIDNVFIKHERLWQQSKQEAIQAVSAGFTDRLNRLRDELSARDATVSSIARYFEDLVADLTDRVHRDPKTRLMNFRRFIEQVEAFLALEQRAAGARSAWSISIPSSGITTRLVMRRATRLSIASRACCANRSAPTT